MKQIRVILHYKVNGHSVWLDVNTRRYTPLQAFSLGFGTFFKREDLFGMAFTPGNGLWCLVNNLGITIYVRGNDISR